MRARLMEWLGTAFPGYQSLGAASGEEALALVAAHPPALVVMDFALPGINGIETTRQIKQIAPNTSIILLSMYEAEAYQVEAVAAGASAYLFKRTMHSHLEPTLRALQSAAKPAPLTAPTLKPARARSAEAGNP